MRWLCHSIDHHFRLKRFQMASVLSVNGQQPTLVKCERWQAFLKSLYLVHFANMAVRWFSHSIDHHFPLKHFQMASVLSVSSQQPILVKCERWQAFLKSLYLVHFVF